RAQVRTPGHIVRPSRFGARLANGIGAFKPTEVATVARTCTGDKEGHRPRRPLGIHAAAQHRRQNESANPDHFFVAHAYPPKVNRGWCLCKERSCYVLIEKGSNDFSLRHKGAASRRYGVVLNQY